MYNDILTIGNYTIHGYGLMIGLGVLFAYLDAEHRAKKNSIPVMEQYVLPSLIWCVVFGLIGAKLLYWLTILGDIIKNPAIMLEDFTSGFVVYGGILGGLAALLVYSKRRGLNFLPSLDTVMPSLALAQGFGRIGCLLAGCCYGVEMSGAFAVTFHSSQFAPNGIALVPTQMIASVLDFLNYFVLCALFKKYRVPGREPGRVTACYLLFYSTGRFILEFFRGDLIRGEVGVLSTSQFISLFVAAAGVGMLLWVRKKEAAQN